MSKVITSPVKRWPGTVTIADPLTLAQVAAFERAIKRAEILRRDNPEPTRAELDAAHLPGLLSCVESHALSGIASPLGVDNFPGTPRIDSARLIEWLMMEILALYSEATTDPLA